MPADLDRESIKKNGWTLGSCFTAKGAPELFAELPEEGRDEGAFYLVVTHDCSLISPSLESEPTLECFAAVPVDKLDGAFTHAKNIRRLQLPLLVAGNDVVVELRMAARYFISRVQLPNCCPDQEIQLPDEGRAVLVRWLSNRYTTQALPDAFDRRIKTLLEGRKKPLRKLLQREEAATMLGIYLDLEPPYGELPDNEPYGLAVVLMYDGDSFRSDQERYDAYAEEIRACLAGANGVDVRGVMAISDKDITVHQHRQMRRWQMDFLSFRDDADEVSLIEDGLA